MKSAAGLLVLLGLVAGQVAFDEEAVDGALTEPNRALLQGRAYLEEGKIEDAIEAFRAADIEGGDRGGAVQFNIARALAEDAARSLASAKKDAPAPKPGEPPAEIDPEIRERLQQAGEAFERAYEMSKGGALRSQSAQAAGNAWVTAQDLPRAIEQYRRSLVADPTNEAARRNLARTLRWMRASPPPPPSSGGDNDDEEKDEEKDGEQEQQQPQDGEKKDGEQQQQQPQPQPSDQEKQEGQEKQQQDQEPKPGEEEEKKQAGEDEQKPEEGEKDPKQSPEQKPEQGKDEKGQQKTKAEQNKERARQILDAMRSRERPLDPQLMRDRADTPPRSGKDW